LYLQLCHLHNTNEAVYYKGYLKKRIDTYPGKELIKVLIGQRRVGKSYLLYQTIDGIKEHFPDANIIYINLELNECESIKEQKYLHDFIKSKSAKGKINFVLIDAVQIIPEFEKTLRSLVDFTCTSQGSSPVPS
jgi:predicted AAA+ superfamily ATPase